MINSLIYVVLDKIYNHIYMIKSALCHKFTLKNDVSRIHHILKFYLNEL